MVKKASSSQKSQVSLREVTEGDLPVFFEHQRDPDACRVAVFAARDHDAFTAHWAKILVDESICAMTIVYDRRIAGNVVSWLQDDRRLVGYWIGKEYWGKSLATQALANFVRLDRQRPLYAHVALSNIASRRVLENCGFSIDEEWNELPVAPADGVEEVVMKLTTASPAARQCVDSTAREAELEEDFR